MLLTIQQSTSLLVGGYVISRLSTIKNWYDGKQLLTYKQQACIIQCIQLYGPGLAWLGHSITTQLNDIKDDNGFTDGLNGLW